MVTTGKDQDAANTLITMVITLLQEIGLDINTTKSKGVPINIIHGKLIESKITVVFRMIESISPEEEIKYLGETFNKMLVLEQKVLGVRE